MQDNIIDPEPRIRFTPQDVIRMPLAEFERWFSFRPTDALEKHFFAATGTRMLPIHRAAIALGLCDTPDLSNVVME